MADQCEVWHILDPDSKLNCSLTRGVMGGGTLGAEGLAGAPGDTESLFSLIKLITWLFGLWGLNGLIWRDENMTDKYNRVNRCFWESLFKGFWIH